MKKTVITIAITALLTAVFMIIGYFIYTKIINKDNNIEDKLKEENNKLKDELQVIDSKIYNMNATSINDIENIMQKQQKEIETLKSDEKNMWIMFVFCILLAIYIAYGIGINRK